MTRMLTLTNAFLTADRALQAGVRSDPAGVQDVAAALGIRVTPTGAAWLCDMLPQAVIRLGQTAHQRVYVLRDHHAPHSLVLWQHTGTRVWTVREGEGALYRLRSALATAPADSCTALLGAHAPLSDLAQSAEALISRAYLPRPEHRRAYGNVAAAPPLGS